MHKRNKFAIEGRSLAGNTSAVCYSISRFETNLVKRLSIIVLIMMLHWTVLFIPLHFMIKVITLEENKSNSLE